MPVLAARELRPGDLVAVQIEPGPAWLEILRTAWEGGAAVLPIDHRASRREVDELLGRARPTAILDRDGLHRREGVPAEEGVALVVHTSGTGGRPKLVQFDRRAIDAAVAASAVALGVTQHDRWLACLPLAHVGGLLVVLRGVLLGGPVTTQPSFDVDAFSSERDCTFTSLVPTMLVRLLDAAVDLARYRGILVGGAHLPPDLRERAERAGAHVVETYGLTETCGGVVYDGVPLPGTEIRIDPDGGIEVRGPTLMLGYRFDGQATASSFTEDDWLRSGDAGELDELGRLHVVGRVDDLINSGGETIWPDEVERALRLDPKVAEVGVGGRLDPEWGQRVVAWVVPSDPSDPPTLGELRDTVSATLARYKAPRELVLVDELPRTFSGKLRRRALVAGAE